MMKNIFENSSVERMREMAGVSAPQIDPAQTDEAIRQKTQEAIALLAMLSAAREQFLLVYAALQQVEGENGTIVKKLENVAGELQYEPLINYIKAARAGFPKPSQEVMRKILTGGLQRQALAHPQSGASV